MKSIIHVLLFALLSLNCRAAIVPILRNVFTTNTFDSGIVGGSIPYFDFTSQKFVGTRLVYTNGILFEPTLGFLSIFHTNITGDILLNLAEGGVAGPSIQAFSDRFVVANTNLSFEAVGPYSIRLRINSSNVLEVVADGISLNNQTNIIADSGTALTYNGVPIGSGGTNLTANVLILAEHDLGTIAGAGTATLNINTNLYRAVFSGSTFNVDLPTPPDATNGYWHEIIWTNTSGGTQIGTIKVATVTTALVREELSSAATLVSTVTNATGGAGTLRFRTSAGAWSRVDSSGDALTLGGAALWSSSGGVLEPSPAVNVVWIESQLADNATNAALVVDTAVPWGNVNRSLIKADNDGTNVFRVNSQGGITGGRSQRALWGNDDGEFINMYRVASLGDYDHPELYLEVTSDLNETNWVVLDVDMHLNYSSLNLAKFYGGIRDNVYLVATTSDGGSTTSPTIQGSHLAFTEGDPMVGFTNYTKLAPFDFDGVTPHVLGTYYAHTSGNLLEVQNQGTNKFTISNLGAVSLSGQTNLIGDSGTALTYNGVAIGGGGAPVGTMVESGIVTAGVIPMSTGTSGTNYVASPAQGTGTNVAFNGNITANTGTFTNVIQAGAGSASVNSVGLGAANTGIYNRAGTVDFSIGGATLVEIQNAVDRGLIIKNTLPISFSTDLTSVAPDCFLISAGSATLQLGLSTSSTIAQTLKANNGTGTDKVGANFTLAAGQPTGTGTPGKVLVKVTGTGTGTSATLQSYTTAVALGGTLKTDTTTTGNVDGGADNLISYSVPAQQLGSNGDYLEFDVAGTFGATVNTKQLKIVYGGTTLLDTTSLIFNGVGWRGHGKIIRTSATTQKCTTEFTVGGTLLSAVNSTITTYTTAAETLSGAVTFKVTGEDTAGVPASNAVVQELMVIKSYQGL